MLSKKDSRVRGDSASMRSAFEGSRLHDETGSRDLAGAFAATPPDNLCRLRVYGPVTVGSYRVARMV
jgi:hypothetical protein